MQIFTAQFWSSIIISLMVSFTYSSTLAQSPQLWVEGNVSTQNLLADGFEDGTLPPFTTGGDATWGVQSVDAFAGSRSAESGTITHNQTTYIEYGVTIPDNTTGVITFAAKVSSQQAVDKLNFYIDGVKVWCISGEIDWTIYNPATILAGSHTLKWSYEKDIGISAGNDRALIDSIRIDFMSDFSVRIQDGTQGAGKVLTSDFFGNAYWNEDITVELDEITSQLTPKYKVGDLAQGGIVFFVDSSGEHGLSCATSDQNGGVEVRWYAGTNGNTQARGTGLYAGEMNTAIIISSQVALGDDGSTYAARICGQLELAGYGDWYLPSREELFLMKTDLKQAGLGNFSNEYYWSSTEENNTEAFRINFGFGIELGSDKSLNDRVRAIRAF